MSVSVDSKAGVRQLLSARLHDPTCRGFASDNYAGAPEIIEAVQAANEGHVTGEGMPVRQRGFNDGDEWSRQST